jgi:hypothetical protein
MAMIGDILLAEVVLGWPLGLPVTIYVIGSTLKRVAPK